MNCFGVLFWGDCFVPRQLKAMETQYCFVFKNTCDNLCISVLWSCNNRKITYMCIQCMCIYDNVISETEHNTGLYTNVESG